MRVEDELGATRVGLRILEQADQLRNQGRVETGVALDTLFLAAAIWFKGKRQRKLSPATGHHCGVCLLRRLRGWGSQPRVCSR